MRSLKNWSETLSWKIWFLDHTKIRLNSKDEPSISKIERVTAVFVSQVVTKSQIQKMFKSQNLTDFFDLDQLFFSCEVNYVSESIHKVSRSNNNLEPLNWMWAGLRDKVDSSLPKGNFIRYCYVIFLVMCLQGKKSSDLKVQTASNWVVNNVMVFLDAK